MGTARQDFERFVRWMHEPETRPPEDVRRFANLVLANFDAVARMARQHNNRSQLLARFARESLAQASGDLPPMAEATPQGAWPWTRLRSLTLGPFRGFREPQGFDLSKRLVLCYGPNGSGKSSLCEALEYVLRGSVEEAGSKRVGEAEYLANIHAARFDAPVLTATDAHGREVQVRADEDAFRFFFVEKNRIDNFSRIAATPPGRKTDLIATLFGMDQFNDFASHFNESMDAVLTLETTAQIALNGARRALRTDEETVAGEPEKLRTEDQVATDYAAVFAQGLTFEGLQQLVGSDDAPGRLQELDARLRAETPTIMGLTREGVAQAYANADGGAEMLAATTRDLEAKRNQISFRDLFAAVQQLRATDSEHCPACLTPLAQATRNPFERAEAGLQELAELANMEADRERISGALAEAGRTLRAELRKVEGFLETAGQRESPVRAYLVALPRNRTPRIGGWPSTRRRPTKLGRHPRSNKFSKSPTRRVRKTL